MNPTTPEKNPAALHAVAILTAAATFPLIFMGGLVTTKGAGMSVPDWPNSYGYNMFLFPPRLWIGGIFYEHTHRLMGTVVGLLSIILTIVAWRTERRLWVKCLATAVLGMVIFQGVLGGLRVVLVNLDLAIVHACVAQAFLCLAALVCVVTSNWWMNTQTALPLQRQGVFFIKLALATVTVIYVQLIIGAVMRHGHAGLAIPDVPYTFGKFLPPTSAPQLDAANAELVKLIDHSRTPGFERDAALLPNVTFFQVWIAFAHRMGAIIVSGFVLALAATVLLRHSDQKALARPAWLVLVLICTQVTLGILTVLWRKPADLTSLHVAVGALLLLTCFVLAIRALRLYSSAFRQRQSVEPASDVHELAAVGSV